MRHESSMGSNLAAPDFTQSWRKQEMEMKTLIISRNLCQPFSLKVIQDIIPKHSSANDNKSTFYQSVWSLVTVDTRMATHEYENDALYSWPIDWLQHMLSFHTRLDLSHRAHTVTRKASDTLSNILWHMLDKNSEIISMVSPPFNNMHRFITIKQLFVELTD